MNGLLDVITGNILPIFLVAGVGYLLRRTAGLEPKSLSRLVFYAFSPCLVFVALVESQLPAADLLDLAAFAALNIIIMGLIGFAISRLLRLTRPASAVLIIVIMFVNGGNYGLTLNQLRYGEAGLSRAVVYFLVSTIFVYTVGVFVASAGRQPWQEALRGLLRVPAVYAVAIALFVYGFRLPVPTPLMSAVRVAADGAIPVMIVVLGMQLADMGTIGSWRFATLATFLRLVVGVVVAAFVADLIGLEGLNRSTSIIEASMPTAVITTILATEYEVMPATVTGVVALSTLVSPLTVALTIQLFGL